MNGLNLNDIQEVIENTELEDQTVSTGGNFEIRRLPVGTHPVRLISYIEYGAQPQRAYKGEEKPDAPTVALTFEFLGKRTVTEATEDKPETAMKKTIILKKSSHEKAAYRKLFEKMRAGDTSITNMVQMVGSHSWLMDVEWTQGKEVLKGKAAIEAAEAKLKADPDNKDLRIWDNVRNSEGFMISAPFIEKYDEETGDTESIPVTVREPISPLSAFLWDNPNPKFWASIFIEGSYTRTVDGKEEKISKNRHQIKCVSASNYEGSALQAMLDGTDDIGADAVADEPKEEKKEESKKPAKAAEEKPETSSKESAPSETKSPSEPEMSEEEQLLAELGM